MPQLKVGDWARCQCSSMCTFTGVIIKIKGQERDTPLAYIRGRSKGNRTWLTSWIRLVDVHPHVPTSRQKLAYVKEIMRGVTNGAA